VYFQIVSHLSHSLARLINFLAKTSITSHHHHSHSIFRGISNIFPLSI
jgi:hypothetical protein